MSPAEARQLKPLDIVKFRNPAGYVGGEKAVLKVLDSDDPLVKCVNYPSRNIIVIDYFHPEEIHHTGKKIPLLKQWFLRLWWRL